MRTVCTLILFLTIFAQCVAQTVTDGELDLFRELLRRSGERDDAVNFLKDWSGDTRLKLPVVVDILNHPMRFPAFVDDMNDAIDRGRDAQSVRDMAETLGWADSLGANVDHGFDEFFRKNVNTPQDVFSYMEWIYTTAEAEWQGVWANLEEPSRDTLETFGFNLWAESEDSLAYDTAIQRRDILDLDELDTDTALSLVERVRFDRLAETTRILQEGFAAMQKYASQVQWGKREEKITRWGRMIVGSQDRDIYTQSCCFILDPGGDDAYFGRLSAQLDYPFLVLLDLEGDDLYATHQPAETFSVIGGVAVISDVSGDDVYRCGDMAFSSTFGWLDFTDAAGDDIYDVGQYSLGAASFGVCVTRDEQGRDSYAGAQFSQGFGGPLGLGVLADRTGPDHYYAGGRHLHAPLAPLDYRSLSQGFGFGMRPDIAGGIGMLWDGEGADSYQGGVYAQGVGYWYALGILYDREGNDFYNAVYYPQGSGIHLAGGFLYDGAGEDSYYSKHGPGQGAGHDYGIGWLVDRSGDDAYSVEGGNGMALTNSAAFFLDVSGDDRYERDQKDNYGFGRAGRGSGSLGLFLDTGGDDSYPFFPDVPRETSASNDHFWRNGKYGAGFDTLMVDPVEVVEEMAEEQAAEIDPDASIDEIFAIASEWGVGSAAERVKRAGEILLERDEEAAAYIYEEELGTKSGLAFRAITNYAKESKAFDEYIDLALEHADSLWNKNAIALIGALEDEDYLDELEDFAKRGQYKNAALSAIGGIKTNGASRVLERYVSDPSEKTRVIVARGLKNIDTKRSRKALTDMRNDTSFLIRAMVRMMEEKQKENE